MKISEKMQVFLVVMVMILFTTGVIAFMAIYSAPKEEFTQKEKELINKYDSLIYGYDRLINKYDSIIYEYDSQIQEARKDLLDSQQN